MPLAPDDRGGLGARTRPRRRFTGFSQANAGKMGDPASPDVHTGRVPDRETALTFEGSSLVSRAQPLPAPGSAPQTPGRKPGVCHLGHGFAAVISAWRIATHTGTLTQTTQTPGASALPSP